MNQTVNICVYKSKATFRWSVAFEGTHLGAFDTWQEAFNWAFYVATFSGAVR